MSASESVTPIYEVHDLVKQYARVRAVDHVDLTIDLGVRLGVVGESGSGKSTLARMLAGLSRPTSGEILFRGESIVGRSERELGDLRKGVQVVFQDPRSSLDPRMKVGAIITEPLRSPLLRGRDDVPTDHQARLAEVMSQVGLDPESANAYPHQFSGGQRQRIAIARALAPRPAVLIADEAVSALDVSVRAHVLNLIDEIADEEGLTLIFISHDLRVVAHSCTDVVVMSRGQIVERGSSAQVLSEPQSPITRAMVAAVPQLPRSTS